MNNKEKIINIDILEYVLNEDFWDYYVMPRKIYTEHQYKNSPYDCCDSCATCNGALCHICKEKYIEPEFDFCLRSDILNDLLTIKFDNLPKHVIDKISYGKGDTSRIKYKGKIYKFIWPTEKALKERYPDFYNSLYNHDEKIFSLFDKYIETANIAPNMVLFNTISELRESGELDKDTEHHLDNQFYMWYYIKKYKECDPRL